jgi:hypothetical protein
VSMETELLHYQLAGQKDTPTVIHNKRRPFFSFSTELGNAVMLQIRHIWVRNGLS